MDKNIELLNYVYQNSSMGVDATSKLMDIVEDNNMKSHLRSQLEQYKKINSAAIKMINEKGHKEKSINSISKISANMSINMKTIMNKTSSHIAEMLIQGSTMGTIDVTKNINKYRTAEKHILDLGNKLLKVEEYNIQELKKFLGTESPSFS